MDERDEWVSALTSPCWVPGETKWMGRNLLGDGNSDINLVSHPYTFVKHRPVSSNTGGDLPELRADITL